MDTDPIGRVIRLQSDYMCGVPLWGKYGCLNGPDTGLGLSPKLRDDLIAWQDDFEKHFDHSRGWDSPVHATAYAETGRSLLERLQSELPHHDIALDLWPVPKQLRHKH